MAHDHAIQHPLERLAGASPIAALDPRMRIVAAVVWAFVVVSFESLTVLVAAVGTALVTARLAALPGRATARKVLTMDGFVVALLVLLPFTKPGTPIAELGPFAASAEGLHLAVAIALKANAILLMLLALVGTLEPSALGHALARLRVPAALVQLLLFTVRYIAVLAEEAARLRTAMRARAFTPGTNRHTLTTYGYLVGMLLVRAAERAERVLEAMKCRGFDGRWPVLDRPRLACADALAALAGVAVVTLLIIAETALVRTA
jgi:cobalt/nickel transport system permease protein